METTPILTREQRRMIVEHMATACVQDMPSEDMSKADFYRDMHSEEWRIKTMKAIEKVIPEQDWDTLMEELLQYQTFDRNPAAFIYDRGFSDTTSASTLREYMNETISAHIDVVARY